MATRRMISKEIIHSKRFLQLALTAQALYMHLIVSADDDGVVSLFTGMRLCGASDGDADNLFRQDFIRWLVEGDSVVVVTDFKLQNRLQPSRFSPGKYHDLLLESYPEILPQAFQQTADTLLELRRRNAAENSKVKNSIGKDSLSSVDGCQPKERKTIRDEKTGKMIAIEIDKKE
ncbi:MAG: hypothetical protein K6C34_00515 [Alphaproteobacteria bacterium]|nr:hypothetical protein [Alphaproteobacteria bacterium]